MDGCISREVGFCLCCNGPTGQMGDTTGCHQMPPGVPQASRQTRHLARRAERQHWTESRANGRPGRRAKRAGRADGRQDCECASGEPAASPACHPSPRFPFGAGMGATTPTRRGFLATRITTRRVCFDFFLSSCSRPRLRYRALRTKHRKRGEQAVRPPPDLASNGGRRRRGEAFFFFLGP